VRTPSKETGVSRPSTVIDHDVDVPLRDGVLLRADVWRPADDVPRPAIVYRTPYGKDTMRLDTLAPADCVAAGYAAVVQDVRGRGASQGQWLPLEWDHEGPDGYDTVEWVAAQPWCDGNVGMAGTSYLGIVQWLAAAARPPHLKAIAPAMTTSLSLDLRQTGGAFRLDHAVSWLAFTAAERVRRAVAAGEPVAPETLRAVAELLADPRAALRRLPVADILGPADLGGDLRALFDGELRTLSELDYADVAVPTFSVSGWYDVFSTGTVSLHLAMRAARDAPGEHCLVMGPWAHSGSLPQVQGELNTGIQGSAAGARLPALHLEFFDRHLRGAARAPAAVRYFLMGADTWHTAECWPPPGTEARHWYLHSDGDARTAAGSGVLRADVPHEAPGRPSAPARDGFEYDPDDPAPSHGGRLLYLGRLVPGPLDQARLEARADVVCYTSGPLAEPLEAVGRHRARLFFSSSASDTDLVAKLTDVAPDGASLLVAEGSLRLRYREGFDREVFLKPGEPVEAIVELGDAAWRFAPGHRLRLDVTSSNFPHLDRNLNTEDRPGLGARSVTARQLVWHGADCPSRLELEVLAAPSEAA
jgi:uncharacterized protein